MKKSLIKHLSLVMLICMLFSILGTSCVVDPGETTIPEDIIEPLPNQEDTSGNVDTGGIP